MGLLKQLPDIDYTFTESESNAVITALNLYRSETNFDGCALRIQSTVSAVTGTTNVLAWASTEYPVSAEWTASPNALCVNSGNESAPHSPDYESLATGVADTCVWINTVAQYPGPLIGKYVLIGLTNDRAGSLTITPILYERA
jgi:hypothetical protein